jgi:magnesium transporter
MIHSFYHSSIGTVTMDMPPTDWPMALHDQKGMLWVDFHATPLAVVEPHLRDPFGFHALAIDDALHEVHVPKIDDWGDYLYAVAHGIMFDQKSLALTTRELDIFLGPNYLVTYHRQAIDAVERVWRNICKDQRRLTHGADYLLYLILDALTADYMPAIDALDTTLDTLETTVFTRPTPYTLGTIFAVKRAALHLRRIIGPQREVLNKLARDEYTVIDPDARVYFRDIYDHLVRLADLNDTLRDLTSGALDIYLSATSNQINQVMKVLTIISALFMPISFLVGFFGMNFSGLPFDNPWLLAGAIGVILATPLLMLFWFKQRGWLSATTLQRWQYTRASEAADQKPYSQKHREDGTRKFPRQEHASGGGGESPASVPASAGPPAGGMLPPR